MDVVSATVFLSAAEPVKNEETFESDALELKRVFLFRATGFGSLERNKESSSMPASLRLLNMEINPPKINPVES